MIARQKRLAIVQHVRTCKGTPFQHQGRLPGVGLDCIGLAIEAAKAAGEFTPALAASIPPYGPVPHSRKFLTWLQTNLVEIKRENVLIGDLAMIRIANRPMHIAVVADRDHKGTLTGPFTYVHSDARQAKVDEKDMDSLLRVYAFFRLPNLAKEEAA
jgi:hypothetical protein